MKMSDNVGFRIVAVIIFLIVGFRVVQFAASCVFGSTVSKTYKARPEQNVFDDFGNILLYSEESYAPMRWCCEEDLGAIGRWDNSKRPYQCVYRRSSPIAPIVRATFVKCVESKYKNAYVLDEETDRFVPIDPYDFAEIRPRQ